MNEKTYSIFAYIYNKLAKKDLLFTSRIPHTVNKTPPLWINKQSVTDTHAFPAHLLRKTRSCLLPAWQQSARNFFQAKTNAVFFCARRNTICPSTVNAKRHIGAALQQL